MSFGISAIGWLAIGGATLGAGAIAYSADQSRKSQHEAMDAEKQAELDDARQKAELDTSTALAANGKFAQDKRARQANVLALGGVTDALGGAAAGGQVLGASQSTTGAPKPTVLGNGAGPAAPQPIGVLGSGARSTVQPVGRGIASY